MPDLAALAADHLGDPIDAAYVRLGVSLVAIAAARLLSVGHLWIKAERRRSEQRYRTIFDRAGFPIRESDCRLPAGTLRTASTINIRTVRRALLRGPRRRAPTIA